MGIGMVEIVSSAEYEELLTYWGNWDQWDIDARLMGVGRIPPIPGMLEGWVTMMRAYRDHCERQKGV